MRHSGLGSGGGSRLASSTALVYERQTADGDFRQTVLKANHLALFRDAQAAFQASRGLRKQRPRAPEPPRPMEPTTVEQRQFNTGFRRS